MGGLLCWLGLHSWRRFNGRLVVTGDQNLVIYDRECRRCGLTQHDRNFVV